MEDTRSVSLSRGERPVKMKASRRLEAELPCELRDRHAVQLWSYAPQARGRLRMECFAGANRRAGFATAVQIRKSNRPGPED